MNTDTKDTATIQRLSDDLAQMEQENIQLRQQIIKLQEKSIDDMTVTNFFNCYVRLMKEHPIRFLWTISLVIYVNLIVNDLYVYFTR